MDHQLLTVPLPAEVDEAIDKLMPLLGKKGIVIIGSGRMAQWNKIVNFLDGIGVWGK